jgi:hypothetical protein
MTDSVRLRPEEATRWAAVTSGVVLGWAPATGAPERAPERHERARLPPFPRKSYGCPARAGDPSRSVCSTPQHCDAANLEHMKRMQTNFERPTSEGLPTRAVPGGPRAPREP